MKKAAIVAAGLIAGGGFATTAAPGNQFVQTILVARVESSGVLGVPTTARRLWKLDREKSQTSRASRCSSSRSGCSSLGQKHG